ncbi:hypothetical protein STEG23_014319 [Scotinomys teguina]
MAKVVVSLSLNSYFGLPSHVVLLWNSLGLLLCYADLIKSTNPGISIGDVAKKFGEMWNNLSDSEKQPYITKAAKLKKYEKDVADYKSKGKFDGAKGPAKVARKKVEEEEEEEEDE